jgi:hypothetical protein
VREVLGTLTIRFGNGGQWSSMSLAPAPDRARMQEEAVANRAGQGRERVGGNVGGDRAALLSGTGEVCNHAAMSLSNSTKRLRTF